MADIAMVRSVTSNDKKLRCGKETRDDPHYVGLQMF